MLFYPTPISNLQPGRFFRLSERKNSKTFFSLTVEFIPNDYPTESLRDKYFITVYHPKSCHQQLNLPKDSVIYLQYQN